MFAIRARNIILLNHQLRALGLGQVRFGGTIPVILIQDLEKRGQKGDVISVRRGYARNLLIPRKIAVYATKENQEKYSVRSEGQETVENKEAPVAN